MARKAGHLAALTRSHLIGDHPLGLTKEQITETMALGLKQKEHCFCYPRPKTKGPLFLLFVLLLNLKGGLQSGETL